MKSPHDLITLSHASAQLPAGSAMFCGTLAVRGDIRFATQFEIELADPVLGRSLRHAYNIVPLADEG